MHRRYHGINLRHQILLEFHKKLSALPESKRELSETEASLTVPELATAIGANEPDVQIQVDFLIHQKELEFVHETPQPIPFKLLLTFAGASAIAGEKYLSEIRILRNSVLDARWRTVTGWFAAIALALSAIQLWQGDALEKRLQQLEHRLEQVEGRQH